MFELKKKKKSGLHFGTWVMSGRRREKADVAPGDPGHHYV